MSEYADLSLLMKHGVALQIRGCFWHLHRCVKCMPQAHAEFWLQKLQGNRQRDMANDRKLRRLGWRVGTIWQCELDRMTDSELQAWLGGLGLI